MPRLTLPAIAAVSLTLRAISTERVELRALAAGRLPLPTEIVQAGAPPTPPPALISAPVATGLMRIGELLTSTDGVWSDATGFTRQWYRDATPITGEVAATYTVVAADIAAQITCRVTATGPGGTSAPEASNALVSVWRPILLVRPGVLIWDSQDPYCYGGAGVGSPVASIYTVDGVLIGSQATSGARPTRLTNGLSFDGVDDHLICNTHAQLLKEAHTFVVGFNDPSDGVAIISTLLCASANSSGASTRQVSVNYSYPSSPNATRQRYYTAEAASASCSLGSYSIGAGPYDMALRSGTYGGTQTAVRLDGSLTAISSTTRGADGGWTFSWLYLGCRAIGATPGLAQYWQGRLRHLALDDTQWSDTDTALYRACALAAGVM